MTLQNGAVCGRNAYLWCDTALWSGETGKIIGHAPKAFLGESWPYAMTFSTWGPSHEALIEIMKAAESADLDEALENASDALRWFVSIGGLGRILVASYEGRPRLHIVPSSELFPGYAAFEPIELDHFACSGNQTTAYRIAARRGFTPKRMRRVIEEQCETPWAVESGYGELAEQVWIGGDVERIQVSAAGVSSQIEMAVDKKEVVA